MDYRKFGEQYYIRLDKGDEILSSLVMLCEQESIGTARIQGIGGCSNAVVGVFDPEKKDYDREEVTTAYERDIAAELIRETILEKLQEEIGE